MSPPEFVLDHEYRDLIASKAWSVPATGIPNPIIPVECLFPFQADLVRWSLRRGRAALFEGTGLGKTRQAIVWSAVVSAHTGGRVLILCPLGVRHQFADEGALIGVDVRVVDDGSEVGGPGVYVTNYDRLHRFDASLFVGVVCDEASCVKHHDSQILAALLAFTRRMAWLLTDTATPAPNDWSELGQQAELLGICTREEMLAEFFRHDGGNTQVWRLKRHAANRFWRWVASWAALVRAPSDLGYPDDGYKLPPLHVHQHTIAADKATVRRAGTLVALEAQTLSERQKARRASMPDRVAACAARVNADHEAWVVWCDLNDESDALLRAIPDAVEVRGPMKTADKERVLADFAAGRSRVLVTKPSICGWGLNWQHCAHMAYVGVTDSWEAYYQTIRRAWRFGQQRDVNAHVYASEMEGAVVANLARKEAAASEMADRLSAATRDVVRAEVRGLARESNDYRPEVRVAIPNWLQTETTETTEGEAS